MNIFTKYMFHVVGEGTERLPRLHRATIERTKAFAIAIHIPVILWAVTGYVIAAKIFEMDAAASVAIATFCATIIYMIERIVLATPKKWCVNICRILIGLTIAVIGSSAVDLVIFDKEVSNQLIQAEGARVNAEYGKYSTKQEAVVAQKKIDWFRAQDAANCEANGECGSKTRSIGPIYRALSQQANVLHGEYLAAQAGLNDIKIQNHKESQIAVSKVRGEAGLLARIEALHQYTWNNKAALVGWALCFLLIFAFEMMVVLVKLVFNETVDDKIEILKGELDHITATNHVRTLTSPIFNTNKLLEQVYA